MAAAEKKGSLMDLTPEKSFRELLEKAKNALSFCDEATKKSDSGNTVLMTIVRDHNWPKAARALIERCPTHKVSLEDDRGIVMEQSLPYVDAVNDNGETALHIALANDHKETARVLMENGAGDKLFEAVAPKRAKMSAASEKDLEKEFIYLLREPSSNAAGQAKYRDIDLTTVLMKMVMHHDWPDAAAALIARGSQYDGRLKKYVNWEDKDGKTALHWAAYKWRRATVGVLLASGADRFIKDKTGLEPAEYANRGEFGGNLRDIDETPVWREEWFLQEEAYEASKRRNAMATADFTSTYALWDKLFIAAGPERKKSWQHAGADALTLGMLSPSGPGLGRSDAFESTGNKRINNAWEADKSEEDLEKEFLETLETCDDAMLRFTGYRTQDAQSTNDVLQIHVSMCGDGTDGAPSTNGALVARGNCQTVLMEMAISHDWPDAAKALLEKFGCNFEGKAQPKACLDYLNAIEDSCNPSPCSGYTALHWAIQEGHPETAALLLQAGTDRTIKDGPLVSVGHLKLDELVIELKNYGVAVAETLADDIKVGKEFDIKVGEETSSLTDTTTGFTTDLTADEIVNAAEGIVKLNIKEPRGLQQLIDAVKLDVRDPRRDETAERLLKLCSDNKIERVRLGRTAADRAGLSDNAEVQELEAYINGAPARPNAGPSRGGLPPPSP